jgi:hypothetical protein
MDGWMNGWMNGSVFLIVLFLVVGVDFVHEGVVLVVHHVFVCVDGDVIEVDGQQDLLLHDGPGRVVRQLYVEETGVGLGQRLILVLLVGQHWLYHEADVVSLVLLAVYRQSLLSPAETNYLQLVSLWQLPYGLPEEFYPA